MAQSPWAMSALADYLVGACFSVMFLYLRDGPSFFGIPSKVIAIMLPFLGNYLLMWYAAYIILFYRNLTIAFLPRAEQEPIPSGSPRKTMFISILFKALLAFFLIVCVWAFFSESVADGINTFKTARFAALTLIDNAIGLVFTASFFVIREGGLSTNVILWLLGFVLLGNAPTCVYVITLIQEAERRNVPFEHVLLSPSRSSGHAASPYV